MSDTMLQRRLLTPFLLKKVPLIPEEHERKVYPKTVNPLSWVFFWWLMPILKTGYKRTLVPSDLFQLNDSLKVETMTARFEADFSKRLAKLHDKHVSKKIAERGENVLLSSVTRENDLADFVVPKLLVAVSLVRTLWQQFMLSCVYLAIANTGSVCLPLLSKKLILYVEVRALGLEDSAGKGVGYAIGTAALVLVSGIFRNHAFQSSMLVGAQMRGLLMKAYLDKAVRLSPKSRHTYTASKITSMIGSDLSRIDFAMGYQPFLITFPIPIAIAIGILILNIGVSALAGVGYMIVFLFCIIFFTTRLFTVRRRSMIFTDRRVAAIKEIISNLKVIKFYSWEDPYFNSISETRREEMSKIYELQVYRNVINSLALSLTLFASMISFLVLYARAGSTKNPASLFASLTLFNALAQLVIMLPLALASGADAYVGVIRASDYLSSSETVRENLLTIPPELAAEMKEKDISILVEKASFDWESFDETDKNVSERKLSYESSQESSETATFKGLRGITLTLRKGEFVAVTGVIASGKSSLLQALSGHMKRVQGSIYLQGSLILGGTPWIQNTTVRNNILFGHDFDEKKYRDVVYACSLESDLEILSAGDNTEIGERGITLSGGQKARISLARAVYADTDIIFLDDVLSAVDARVGKHIMSHCIMGLLKNKTRVLATHQLSLIGSADKIVFMNGDGTIDVGQYEELRTRNTAFDNLVSFNYETTDSGEQDSNKDTQEEKQEWTDSKKDVEATHYNYEVNRSKDGHLISKEQTSKNRIKFTVHKNYVKYGSGVFKKYSIVPVLVLASATAVFCQLFTNVWLSFWSEKRFSHLSNGTYIGIYVMFTFLALVFMTLEFVLIAYFANTAARNLNLKAVETILKAPMAFMDVTPMGRILNRFTKDTDVLDNEISNQMRLFCYVLSSIIGVIILCIIYLPWFAIAVPFLAFLFIAISSFYQASALEIKRLESTQRSLVYNNISETLNGMDTILEYDRASHFIEKNDQYIDTLNEAYFLTIASQRWLGIQLDVVAVFFTLIICLLCVFRVFNISAASVGLLVSYVLQIANQLSQLIRSYTSLENEMNSVERICEYAFDIPQEAPFVVSETTPPGSWPQYGLVEFINASLAYRPELPLVLKNVSFSIKPMEKIGICGRTGAGKSSIISALYRITELSGGRIDIDGIDISTLGLNTLRSSMSIIPQEPVLFKGTIRKNLDPFDHSTDDELWSALKRAGLIDPEAFETVKQQNNSENFHRFHLSHKVEDDGINFSLGERQLIAFARALVRGSKILILDEATSSVDYETDSKIQQTMVREFLNCTILCIAHRLRTILNYDRIIVLDRGEVQQFDTPWNLYNADGIFRQMCDKSDISEKDFRP